MFCLLSERESTLLYLQIPGVFCLLNERESALQYLKRDRVCGVLCLPYERMRTLQELQIPISFDDSSSPLTGTLHTPNTAR